MAAAGGKSKLADAAARCRRHPSHRHAAGVCPFCLSDRLARLSVTGTAAKETSASSSLASSPRSSGQASSVSVAAPPSCREARRARLGLLMRQEETEALGAAGRHGQEEEKAAAPTEGKKTKKANFWTRLQQGSWYRKDGCSLAHSKAPGEKSSAPPKCAPLF